MRNQMPDGGGRGPFCTCYGGVRQTESRSCTSLSVGVLGQRIEIPHTPVSSVYTLAC